MTRAQRLLTILAVFAAIYAVLFFEVIRIPGIDTDTINRLLLALPFAAITGLGTYCVVDLVSGVLSMGDAKEAHEELLKDIAAAKQDLKAQGISID